MGIGGSTGGGSTGGLVDFPDYMKGYHEDFLSAAWTIVQAELGSDSPYKNYSTVDPNFTFGVGGNWYTPAEALLALLDMDLASIFNDMAADIAAFTDNIAAETASHAALLATRLTNEIYPRFEAGILDIGAVCSSAFAIGRAILEDTHTKLAADFEQKARNRKLETSWQFSMNLTGMEIEKNRLVGALSAEVARLYTAARYEVDVSAVNMSARDRNWDMDTIERASNILASISGAAVSRGEAPHASALGGALSGAMAGASMGAMVGSVIPGVGTGIGAIVGGGLGLIASLFG